MPAARIRAATVDDAPALGRLMVETWLSAHRGQMPRAAWQKRADEWTPEVSADAWRRLLDAQSEGEAPRTVLLVAEDEWEVPLALVMGSGGDDDAGTLAEISALYVLPDRQGEGIGEALLRAAAGQLAALGFTSLHVCVLTTNLRARTFYEAMGGRECGQRVVDEEGFLLPQTVYEWSDLTGLGSDGRVRLERLSRARPT